MKCRKCDGTMRSEMKRYRYRKIRPEDVELMRIFRDVGMSYREIGVMFGIAWSTAMYHLSEREKLRKRTAVIKTHNKMTKGQLKEKQLKTQNYRSKYMIERYRNDEEFRGRMKKVMLKCSKNRIKIWKEKGLCSSCGKERENKSYIRCENCRLKQRIKYKICLTEIEGGEKK